MRAAVFLTGVLGSLAGWTLAQAEESPIFEDSAFNITQALLDQGVDPSQLPPASEERKRSSSRFQCTAACTSLSLIYGDKAVLTSRNPAYGAFKDGYWSSQQVNVDPACIFVPSVNTDLSVLVLLSRLTECPFAVKSGGHAAFKGASNIPDGITVSLEKLKQIKLAGDKKSVVIQPGNNWGEVYAQLEKQDVTVTGGRVTLVGTGGLTLGGGISYFANLYGWACDNVISYEVVTATGLIVTASAKSFPHLYWALRGGGNNFGIVTAFNFEAHPLPGGTIWGGVKLYTVDPNGDAVAEAFAHAVEKSPEDPNASLLVAWTQLAGQQLAGAQLSYAKPGGGDAAIFQKFNDIPAAVDDTRDRNQLAWGQELDTANPYGFRDVYACITVKADAEMAKIAQRVYYEEQPPVSDPAVTNPSLVMQGITEGQIKAMSKNGGNPLGLSGGPLYLFHIGMWWDEASGDDQAFDFVTRVFTRIVDEAKKRGLESDYLYMNYAAQFQNVVANYGPENVAKLKKIQGLFDPTKVFERLQPGHFKLDGAPIPDSRYFSGLRA